MSKVDSLESLNKISSTVSERDKKIWENEAHSVCIKKATEELDREIKRMKQESDEIEKENNILETRLKEIFRSVAVQKETLTTNEKSILIQRTLKENLVQERDKMRSKYAHLLQMYEDEYYDYRNIYMNNSKSYKDLREKQIKLKKMKITGMNLDVKISHTQQSLKQFKNIQNQMLQATIIKFAKFFTLYHKNAKIQTELQERKNEEKKLMMEHLELMKIAKEKQTEKAQERNRNRMIQSLTSDVEKKLSEEKTEQQKENKDSTAELLQKFLNEEIEPFSLTPIESTSQQAEFCKDDHSKVRILEMKVIRSMPLQINAMNKPDPELRKKMESIIETTRKNALWPSSTQVTPSASQQSQQDIVINETPTNIFQNSGEKCESFTSNLSQNSQKLSLTPKEKVPINPILKHTKERPNQSLIENSDINKDETTSKFFIKKKNVTFQTEGPMKISQERNDMLENRFTFQNDKNQDGKDDQVYKFPSGINKENMNPVELKSMDVFRKPFNFLNESITKQEKRKSDNFIQNSHFGMFAQSQEKRQESLDFETVLNSSNNVVFGSSTVPFTGPSEADQPQDQTFDPFEASFNPNSFVQSPLNTTEEFIAPASESHTFNFFGSQNKSNLFTMF